MNIRGKFNAIKGNKTLRNGTLFSAFAFVNKGFTFLLLLVLANFITPTEYGYLSLFTTVFMVVSYFMAMSTEGYMSVAFFKDKEYGIRQTFSCILAICVTNSFILMVALIVGGEKLSSLFMLPTHILYLTVVLSFFNVFLNINLDYLRLREKVIKYGTYSCTNAILNFAVSIILVKTLSMGWEGRVYAQVSCLLLFGVIGLYTFIAGGYLSMPDKNYLKKMLIWGIPLIPHLATNFIRQGCDRYIINYFYTVEDVGLFSFALSLVNIITMLGTGFNQSNSVDIYKVLSDQTISNERKYNITKKQIKLFNKIYFVLPIIISLIGYYLFPLIFPKYSGSMNYFLLLSSYGMLICMYLVYTNYLFYYSETKELMYITFGSSVLHLLLSLLVTRYSLYLTACLYVITQLLVVLLVRRKAMSLLQRNLNVNFRQTKDKTIF